MQVRNLSRVIVFDRETLADLDPNVSVDRVVAMHALTRPELATAVVEGPEIKDGTATYTVKTRLGTKG